MSQEANRVNRVTSVISNVSNSCKITSAVIRHTALDLATFFNGIPIAFNQQSNNDARRNSTVFIVLFFLAKLKISAIKARDSHANPQIFWPTLISFRPLFIAVLMKRKPLNHQQEDH